MLEKERLLIKKNTKKVYFLISLAISTIYFSVLMFCFDWRFDLNDDMAIKNILSGAYTGYPNAHAIYIQFPLGLLLSSLYKVTKGYISVYSLFIIFSSFISFTLINYAILNQKNTVGKKAALTIFNVLLWVVFASKDLIFSQYTVTSAILAATAIFLLITYNEGWIKIVILMSFSFMLRYQMAILALPFLLVAMLWGLVNENNDKLRSLLLRYFKLLLGISFIFVSIYLWHRFVYLQDGYGEYLAFNDVRTELYDYIGIPSYSDNEEIYKNAELTYEDYLSLVSYNIDLNDDITYEKLYKLVDLYGEKEHKNYKMADIKELIYKYVYNSIHPSDQPFFYGLALLYILFALLVFVQPKQKKVVIMILPVLAIGRSIIWIYLMLKGRYPIRITDSLYLIEIFLLFGMVTVLWKDISKRTVGIIAMSFALIGLMGGFSYKQLIRYNKEVKKNQEQYAELMEYIKEHDDVLFIQDVYSFAGYTEKMFEEKNECKLANYSLAGGWLSRSPVLYERMDNLFGETDISKLVESGKLVFIKKQ